MHSVVLLALSWLYKESLKLQQQGMACVAAGCCVLHRDVPARHGPCVLDVHGACVAGGLLGSFSVRTRRGSNAPGALFASFPTLRNFGTHERTRNSGFKQSPLIFKSPQGSQAWLGCLQR